MSTCKGRSVHGPGPAQCAHPWGLGGTTHGTSHSTTVRWGPQVTVARSLNQYVPCCTGEGGRTLKDALPSGCADLLSSAQPGSPDFGNVSSYATAGTVLMIAVSYSTRAVTNGVTNLTNDSEFACSTPFTLATSRQSSSSAVIRCSSSCVKVPFARARIAA